MQFILQNDLIVLLGAIIIDLELLNDFIVDSTFKSIILDKLFTQNYASVETLCTFLYNLQIQAK